MTAATQSVIATVRIGISGWTYKPWRGVFFPEGLRQKDELAYASRSFSTIEINGTFYSLQRPSSFAGWDKQTPSDFVFSIKGGRFITHIRRLRDCEIPLANFFSQGLLRFGAKLGPILWQLPPNFKFDPARIEAFLRLLPKTTSEATALARKHTGMVKGRASLKAKIDAPLRHAFEIRHESFAVPEFIGLLRAHNVALVCADTVEWPRLMDTTADFVYCRLHGSDVLYASGYSDAALEEWADRVSAWATGAVAPLSRHVVAPQAVQPHRDVYVYFDNDIKVHAPYDAQQLHSKTLVRLAPAAAGSAPARPISLVAPQTPPTCKPRRNHR